MRSILASSFVLSFSAFVLGGCAVSADRDEAESEADTSESAGALSAYGEKLVGAFATTSPSADFDNIVLRADGTYFTTKSIKCIKAPCEPLRDDGKFIGYKPKGSGFIGGLRLVSKKGTSTYYRVSLGEANQSFKLARIGGSYYAYASTTSYCQVEKDCAGQSYPVVLCVGKTTCSENRCGVQCDTTGPSCNYDDPSKSYIGKDLDTCSRIRFACAEGGEYFSDDCGCGCTVPKPCTPQGCSGEICADEPRVSICIWREEFACYAKATCARDAATGACAWVKTPELTACLGGAAAE